MQLDRSKLKSLVLYTCGKCKPERLGAVKLHKVLYFSDMLHFAETGTPITGATYRKRPHGPTCDQLLATLSELEKSGELEVRNVNYFGYLKKEFAPKGTHELRLGASEKALVDEVIEFVCDQNTAKTISEFSHNRAWEMAEFGEILPYASAFYMFPSEVSPEAFAWAEKEAKEIEAARSRGDTVGFVDFRTFRSRVSTSRS